MQNTDTNDFGFADIAGHQRTTAFTFDIDCGNDNEAPVSHPDCECHTEEKRSMHRSDLTKIECQFNGMDKCFCEYCLSSAGDHSMVDPNLPKCTASPTESATFAPTTHPTESPTSAPTLPGPLNVQKWDFYTPMKDNPPYSKLWNAWGRVVDKGVLPSDNSIFWMKGTMNDRVLEAWYKDGVALYHEMKEFDESYDHWDCYHYQISDDSDGTGDRIMKFYGYETTTSGDVCNLDRNEIA